MVQILLLGGTSLKVQLPDPVLPKILLSRGLGESKLPNTRERYKLFRDRYLHSGSAAVKSQRRPEDCDGSDSEN